MCQVWFHAFSVKSDQGSQRWPKGIAVYVNFSIPPSLVITQFRKSLKIIFSSISPYSHNISFSPSSLLCTSFLWQRNDEDELKILETFALTFVKDEK